MLPDGISRILCIIYNVGGKELAFLFSEKIWPVWEIKFRKQLDLLQQ